MKFVEALPDDPIGEPPGRLHVAAGTRRRLEAGQHGGPGRQAQHARERCRLGTKRASAEPRADDVGPTLVAVELAKNQARAALLSRTARDRLRQEKAPDQLLLVGRLETAAVHRETVRAVPGTGKLTVLPARMNPDLAMDDELLKKTGAGNRFMVFSAPESAEMWARRWRRASVP